MRKSIIAGLTLFAAVGLCAGQAMADNSDGAPPRVHRSHGARKPPRVAETPAPEPYFRIPTHPEVWDCVHVMFPQCARGYEPLNDGTRGRY
jgi:hypothetical protein